MQTLPTQVLIRRTFLVLGALFGACYALILPPLQAPDEFAHFYRAYSVSEGYCVAPQLSPLPKTLEELAAGFQPHVEARRRISIPYILRYVDMPLDAGNQDLVRNEAANMYSCVPYLPSAMAIAAGRVFNFSPGLLLYAGRLANLMAYVAIVFLALRQLPGFHLPMMCLALMPMALNQAASSSWDGVAFSAAFFLCAYIIRLAWDPRLNMFERKHYLTLGAAVIVASLCKTDAYLSPMLVFVPAARFGGTRRRWIAVLGFVALALVVISGWNYINRLDIALWVAHIQDRQIVMADNIAFLTGHPARWLEALGRTLQSNWEVYLSQFVGRLGWLVVILPTWIIWMYVALLGMLAVADDAGIALTAGNRLVCAAICMVATLSIFIGMWCAETPLEYKDLVLHGSGHIPGVQGRYFIPFAFPLLLVFSNRWLPVNRNWLAALAAVVVLTTNTVAVEEIASLYYTTGDPAKDYENKLVRRFGSAPEDSKVFFIQSGKKRWVMNPSWMEKQGYRKPDDFLMVTAQELARIPDGPVVSEQ